MNIEQAKQIPLEAFLSRIGVEPVRQTQDQLWYTSPLRVESTPSFKVNRSLNAWFDFGQGEGGDILDLVMQLERLDGISAALKKLDSIYRDVPRPKRQPAIDRPIPTPSALELETIGPVAAKSLATYLRKRGIEPKSVFPYVHEAHYKCGKDRYFALAFANDSQGYELRNPLFKGTLGVKDITTINGNPNRVVVFEGFFDFLSSISMQGGLPDATVIVLNSVSMRAKALAAICNVRPSIVDVYRDHDEAGKELVDYLRNSLPDIEVVDKSELYAGFNDLNEWHASKCRTMSARRQA